MANGREHLKLEIERPCSERWDEMTAAPAGRYCARCRKEVHDLARMRPREIERLLLRSDGELCARVTRHADGSLKTLPEPASRGLAWITAGSLASAGFLTAQSVPAAVVRGKVTHAAAPNAQVRPDTVRFVRNGQQVAEAHIDADGDWRAELPPGTYDVIVGGPLFGERVDDAVLHAGEQEFAPVTPRFAYGHLGLSRGTQETVLVGSMVATISGMSLRFAAHHPFAYLGMMRRRLLRAL